MVSQDNLILITETLITEIELDLGVGEHKITPQSLAELYLTSFVLQTTDDFKHDLDFESVNQLLVERLSDVKATDVFGIL